MTLPSPNFFAVRLGSVTPDLPLPYDLYVMVGSQAARVLKRGEVLNREQITKIAESNGEHFLVPEDQRAEYLRSMREVVVDPGSPVDMRSRFIKESAFLHMHDLFTKREILPVVMETQRLVEEMVAFVSGDVSTIATLMRLSAHDYYTYNHCVNVGVYSIVLAKRIYGDDKEKLMAAGLGGLMHDIGKRRIDWTVINKQGPLTPDEWEEIKRHPQYGMEALKSVTSVSVGAKRAVFEHHEAFDGTGYPRGLSGDEISEISRIVTIADVFDALTTDRTYHRAMLPPDALNKMFGMQPGKFDPTLFRLFNKNFEEKSSLQLPDDFDPCSAQPILRRAK